MTRRTIVYTLHGLLHKIDFILSLSSFVDFFNINRSWVYKKWTASEEIHLVGSPPPSSLSPKHTESPCVCRVSILGLCKAEIASFSFSHSLLFRSAILACRPGKQGDLGQFIRDCLFTSKSVFVFTCCFHKLTLSQALSDNKEANYLIS